MRDYLAVIVLALTVYLVTLMAIFVVVGLAIQ